MERKYACVSFSYHAPAASPSCVRRPSLDRRIADDAHTAEPVELSISNHAPHVFLTQALRMSLVHCGKARLMPEVSISTLD